jgi:hypothetical protein
MRAAAHVRCPNCKAGLKIPRDQPIATCEYCGAQSRVASTMFFQKPAAPPSPVAQVGRPDLPIARRRPGAIARLVPLLVVGGIGTAVYQQRGVVDRVVGQVSHAVSRVSQTVNQVVVPTRWVGLGPPLVADVDADGTADLIGRVTTAGALALAAYSGVDGHELWRTPLGTAEAHTGGLFLAADRVLYASPAGDLASFALGGGAPGWRVAAPERVASMCLREDGVIVVELADKREMALEPRSGTLEPMAARPSRGRRDRAAEVACTALASDRKDAFDPFRARRVRVAGMSPSSVADRAGVGRAVGGTRSRGTRVPMLAYLGADGETRWKVDVPAAAPLVARATELVALTDDRACAIYEPGDGPPRLTCFALASGTRQWDVAIEKGTTIVLSAIAATDRHILVSSWGHLQAFDRETGKSAFRLGQL